MVEICIFAIAWTAKKYYLQGMHVYAKLNMDVNASEFDPFQALFFDQSLT